MKPFSILTFKIVNHLGRHVLNDAAEMFDSSTLLQDAIIKVLQHHTELGIDHDNIKMAISKIVCGGTNVTGLLVAPLCDIGKTHIPIDEEVIVVNLSSSFSSGNKEKTRNIFNIMVENANTLEYLPYEPGLCFNFLRDEPDADSCTQEMALNNLHKQNLQDQAKTLIKTLLRKLNLGYKEEAEKRALVTFVNSYSNILCYIHKYWKKLLDTDFPVIPRKYTAVMSLQMLTMMPIRSDVTTTIRFEKEKLLSHCRALQKLKLPSYKSNKKAKKTAESFLNSDITPIMSLLSSPTIKLTRASAQYAKSKVASSDPPSGKETNDDDNVEVFDPIVGARKAVKNFSPTVKAAVNKINQSLVQAKFYEPIILSDAFMGIEGPEFDSDRFIWRHRIKEKITSKKFLTRSFGLHKYSPGGKKRDFLTIFKIPPYFLRNGQADEYARNLRKAVKQCDELAPTSEVDETVKQLSRFLSTYAGVKVGAKLKGYVSDILSGNHEQSFNYLIESGSMNVDVLSDLRKINSRGGNGTGHTTFSTFYEKCSQILRSDAGAHERRKKGNEDTLYGSTVVSIPDLLKKTIKALEIDVEQKKIPELPPIPSIESIRLQFVPNNGVAKACSNMTGRLNVSRQMQSRTLRKEHPDQHWVNCFTKYHKAWLIELRRKFFHNNKGCVMFVGQDDKAKIPVGDFVPVSTAVRSKSRAIVPVDPSLNNNKAADHDWSKASIIPSVTLFGNIPNEYGGSFYSGGSDGDGELQVVLRDATFDPSDIFDHCAQLLFDLQTKIAPGKSVSVADILEVMVEQTDGGPDHNIAHLRTKLALVAMFVALGVDHLVALRGAPYGSYMNVVERGMSLLNLGLQNLGLVRGEMSDWAEDAVQNAGSMAEVRKKAQEIEDDEVKLARSRAQKLKKIRCRGNDPDLRAVADDVNDARDRAECVEERAQRSGHERENNSKENADGQSSQSPCQNRGKNSDDGTQVCCSYSKINACQFHQTSLKLMKCAKSSCDHVSHHLCQIEYANSKNLSENEMVFVCHEHIQEYYTGGIVPFSQEMSATGKDSSVNEQSSDTANLAPNISEEQVKLTCTTVSSPASVEPVIKKDLKKEWAKSMEKPISEVKRRFECLDLSGRPVRVSPRCDSKYVEMLHAALKKIDPAYDRTIRQASRLKVMPKLEKFIKDHAVQTPYSFSIQKCTSCDICTPFRSQEGPVRDLVLQRQPTPMLDSSRPGHFFPRDEALQRSSNGAKALSDLSCLPSKQIDENSKSIVAKRKNDTAIGGKVSK